MISGIAVDYRHSPIVEDHLGGSTGPAAGDRAPDAPLVRASDGGSLRLYDLFAEHRHTLLLLGGGPGELPDAIFPDMPRRFTVHRISGSGDELIDREGIVAQRYGSTAAAYLIRPDGYVGLRCGRNELAEALPRYFARY